MTPEERNELVLENIRLVTTVVRKMYLNPHVYYSKEDMWQEGVIGLMKAVERFDPDKGFAFSTYAVPMIEGEIRRFIRDNSHTLRYARSDVDALARINRLGKSIDDLTPEDIKNLELTPRNIAAIHSMNATSMNSFILDSNTEYANFVADTRTSEISDEFQLEIIENIKNLVVSKMNPTWRDMIDEWYYSNAIGMHAGQIYLGRKYGLSQVHVSRILRDFKKAFAKKLVDSGYNVPDYILEK